MFARITPYKMKAGSRDAAEAKMHELRGEILALPGIKRFINAMNEDGSGYVVSLVESREISDANQDQIRAVWANFSEFLEAVPTPEGYDVLADWET